MQTGRTTRPQVPPGSTGAGEAQRFEAFLQGKGLKLTRQRQAVMNLLFSHPGHLEAEEIAHQLKNSTVKVSRATVYRTLDLLRECHLVEKLELGGHQAVYERAPLNRHHDHLICTRCGQVMEFTEPRLERLQQEICQRHQFEETHHSLRIFGLCQSCKG